jgi:hypothetical protein
MLTASAYEPVAREGYLSLYERTGSADRRCSP